MATSRRRFGRVRKLPSGRWQVRYAGPDGLDRAAPCTFATKTEAGMFLSAVETDMGRGTWLDPRRSGVTLRSYAEAWLVERTVRGKPLAVRTRETYRHSLDRWVLPGLGELTLDRITPAAVRAWHSRLIAQTGPTATRQAYAVLRAILSTAVADDALHRNPCRITGAGQPRTPERPLLGVDEVMRLAAVVTPYLRSFVLTAFWGHLRLGEIVALRVGNVDLAEGTVTVARQVLETKSGPVDGEPKSGSRRTVHLPPQGVLVLHEHLSARGPALPAARVFVRQDGADVRAHHVHAAWKRAREAVDLPRAHFHDLRHAGLTLAAQSGATLAEVMRRAGHSSARAALTYQHAADQRDADVARRLGDLAAGGSDR